MPARIATENLSVGKTYKVKIDPNDVSQSNSYGNNAYPAKNALSDKFTHTEKGVGQWWKVDFGKDTDVTKIRIKNRSDCCGGRLAKTKVFVSGKLCGSLPSKTDTGKWYEVNCNLTGKEVKLVTVQNTYLSIQGIEVTAKERIVAKSTPVSKKMKIEEKMLSQSSTLGSYRANNALKDRFTHTNTGVGQWWKVDFDQELDITKIRIKNRSDCCGGRLAKTKVMISGKLCGSLPSSTSDGKWYEVNCNLTGSEVKLVTVQNVPLSIQGIEVFAAKANEQPVYIDQDRVSQSSTHGSYTAVSCINGSGKFTHTRSGVGQWWKAGLEENYHITKVRIQNRSDCCGDRLAKTKVFVSGQLCGSLPSKTSNGQWYEVHCNKTGDEVKLVTVQNVPLSIQGIQLFAAKSMSLPVVFDPKRVSQSSTLAHYSAKNGIMDSDSFTHTNTGVGQWWKATFDRDHYITKIRIQNRKDCCGGRLAKTKVMVSGKLCGSLPSSTSDGQWYEVNCALTGDEIKLVTVQNVPLSISNIQAFTKLQDNLPEEPNTLGYTPFETKEEIEKPEETTPPKVGTCTKKGVFGFNGKCYGGNDAKQWLQNLKMPGNNDFVQDIWDDYVSPLIGQLNNNLIPNGCLGDFNTKTLLENPAAQQTKCANFPIPSNEKLSAVSLSLPGMPCPQPVDVEMCAIFDRCGTFGISISGGLISCVTATTGIGAILSPIASAAAFIQFGYSPNRMWEQAFEFMDPNNGMKLMNVNTRSHVYMGASFIIPKLGIRFGGKDISEIFDLYMEGKAYVDFGDKNDFTASNLKALFKDKKVSPPKKILTLLTAAREYSLRIRGTLYLKLAEFTKNVLPDLMLMDQMDLNVLINLGKGIDGDKGSSGMLPGFHVFMKPPPLDIIGALINGIVNSITKILKIGALPIPKLPTLSGIRMGFFIGEKLGFRFQIKSISITCFIKYQDGFGISCKLGADFLSILEDAGKWIAKMGKKLFDGAGKVIMAVGAGLKNFAEDIAAGTKKIFTGIKNAAKKAFEFAKKAVKAIKEKAKIVVEKIKQVHEKAKKAIANAAKKLASALADIGRKFVNAIRNLANAIANIAKKIFQSIFNRSKYNREKRAKEAEKRRKEDQQRREKAAKEAENAREVKRIQEEEAKEEEELEKEKRAIMEEETKDEVDLWRKDLLYQKAINNLNDL